MLNKSSFKLRVALITLFVVLVLLYSSRLVQKYIKEYVVDEIYRIRAGFYDNSEASKHKMYRNKNYILSYSLFGAGSWLKFGKNVENVAKEAFESQFYNNWTVRLYHDNFPLNLQQNLSKAYKHLTFIDVRSIYKLELDLIHDNVATIHSINGRTWRFIPMGDINVDVMCSRDLDSPLIEREEKAVEYWLRTGKTMHIMRDYHQHDVPILAGTWCFRNNNDRRKGQYILKQLLTKAEKRTAPHESHKQNDQVVLTNYMWPIVKYDAIQHDSYLCEKYSNTIPFQEKRNAKYFVGCQRPCIKEIVSCPVACRPKEHLNWEYC